VTGDKPLQWRTIATAGLKNIKRLLCEYFITERTSATMTNEELIICIRQGKKDHDYMAMLCEQNRRYIAKIANRFKRYAEFEDLIQEGYIGLMAAVERYEPQSGVLFMTYADDWITQKMRRYIENNGSNIRIPVYTHAAVIKYKQTVQNFEREHGRKITDIEACRAMGISSKQLARIKNAIAKAKDTSIYADITGTDDLRVLDMVEDKSSSAAFEAAENRIQNEQLKAVLWQEVDNLKPEQSNVLHKYYQGSSTLKECAECIGVSLTRAAQIHKAALRELRKPRHEKKLKPFALDYVRSSSIRGTGVGVFNRTWTSSTERTALKLYEWQQQRTTDEQR
jgi:RNA polymerase sigma factor (sigma-70 family)